MRSRLHVFGAMLKFITMPRSSGSTLRKDVHQVFQEFADGTSMHGVPRIINARTLPARIFWSIICIGALMMFMWQCGILLGRYYSYPKKVNVEIIQRPVPFPAVTVCNVDHLDLLIVNRVERFFAKDNASNLTNDTIHINGSLAELFQQFEESYLEYYEPALTFFYLYYTSGFKIKKIKADLLEANSRLGLFANLGLDLTSKIGVKLDDFILSCRFLDDDCNITTSFARLFDPYYFNCYTFQPQTIIPSRSSRLQGVEYGLSLLIFTGSAGQLQGNSDGFMDIVPGMQQSDLSLATGSGARVVVHAHGTKPHPTAEGYDIPPGFSVSIGVKAHENVRIGEPHGNCTPETTPTNTVLEGGEGSGSTTKATLYTLIGCQNECIQKLIMDRCHCVDNRVSLPTETRGLPYCLRLPTLPDTCGFSVGEPQQECKDVAQKWGKMMECRKKVYENMTLSDPDAIKQCTCYPPCNDIVYDASYSLSTLPDVKDEKSGGYHMLVNPFIEGLTPAKKAILEKSYNTTNIAEKMQKHISRLNVHIAEINIMKSTEAPDYEAIRLISDIGGQLGLWIGISMMTLFEVLQLIADVFRFLTARGRHIGEREVEGGPAVLPPSRYDNGPRYKHANSHDPDGAEMRFDIDRLTTV